jgi:hypothetical protein
MRYDEPSWVDDPKSVAVLSWAAWFFLIAWAVHTGDHVRRGLDVVSPEVSALGSIAGVLQIVAIAFVLTRQRVGALLAVAIGVPAAIGIAAVHLLPDWGSFSDAFPGAHHTGVTVFSWFAASLEISGAIAFAAAGIYALSRTRALTVASVRSPSR